jgi:hypothetical protein
VLDGCRADQQPHGAPGTKRRRSRKRCRRFCVSHDRPYRGSTRCMTDPGVSRARARTSASRWQRTGHTHGGQPIARLRGDVRARRPRCSGVGRMCRIRKLWDRMRFQPLFPPPNPPWVPEAAPLPQRQERGLIQTGNQTHSTRFRMTWVSRRGLNHPAQHGAPMSNTGRN